MYGLDDPRTTVNALADRPSEANSSLASKSCISGDVALPTVQADVVDAEDFTPLMSLRARACPTYLDAAPQKLVLEVPP